MGLAVHAEHGSIGIDDGERVVERRAGPLEEADGQYHTEFPGEVAEPVDQRIAPSFPGQREVVASLILTEVWRLEQLLQQNDFGPACGSLPDQLLGVGYRLLAIPGACHLRGCDGNVSHLSVVCKAVSREIVSCRMGQSHRICRHTATTDSRLSPSCLGV